MPDVKSTRPDPGGMKKAFKTPVEVPSTRVDEAAPADSSPMWDSLSTRIQRGVKNLKKKVGN